MAQPIFVIGRRRSGTKWLSNILANHPEIACVQGRRSGILETGIFDRFPDLFGDLRIDANFYAFLACYSKSDFFRLTGTPEEEFYSSQQRDYFDIFRTLMDGFADRQSSPYWLQKSKSYLLPQFFEKFPDARYVIIRRGMMDNMRSSIALTMSRLSAHRPALGVVISNLFSYYHHLRWEEEYADRDNVVTVRFEDLKADTEGTVAKVCDFLGVDFSQEMLETQYEQNTSFRGNVKRGQTLRRIDRMTIAAVDPLARNLPLSVLHGAFERRSSRRPAFDAPRFHESYFSRFKQEQEARSEKEPVLR